MDRWTDGSLTLLAIVYLCNSGVAKESNAEKQFERWYASPTPMAVSYAFGAYYLCNPVYKRCILNKSILVCMLQINLIKSVF
jgi:hypothetical protein